jgi:membrane associated rhomboid family serine protease/Flp pilus assembly protein TadD
MFIRVPVCSSCGRETDIVGTTCEVCRQHQFAINAEKSATSEAQTKFRATNTLLLINVIVFVLMVLKGVPLSNPGAEQIQRWGGNFGPLTLGGQPWRVFTAVFVHIGIAHIVANMWALLVLGRLAESLYGRATFVFAYILAGLGGSMATLVWNPMATSAGASGALFGIAGALIVTLYVGKLPMPSRAVKPVLVSLAVWAAFSLLYGLWKPGVDNAAHLGGLLTGIAVGLLVAHHLGPEPRSVAWRKRVFPLATIVIVAAGALIYREQGYVVAYDRARRLVSAKKYDDAIVELQQIAQSKPKKPAVHGLLGDVFVLKGDITQAEREFQETVRLQPNSALAWGKLGDARARQNHWAEAAEAYSRAAQLGKDNGYLLYNAGLMYRRSDRHEEAVRLFRLAVERNPYFVDAWYAMGISLLNLKRPAEAIQALQKAVQLRGTDPDIHLWLGNAFLSAGQEQQAQAEFSKAYQLRLAQQRALQELQRRRSQTPQ